MCETIVQKIWNETLWWWVKVPTWAGTDSELIPSFFSVEWSQTCSLYGHLRSQMWCRKQKYYPLALEVDHGIVKGIRMQLVSSVPTLTPWTGLDWGRDRQRYKDISAVSSGCQLPAAETRERESCTRGQHLNDTTSHFSCQQHQREFLLLLHHYLVRYEKLAYQPLRLPTR